MVIYTDMKKCQRISFYLSHKQWIDLRIMCVVSEKTISEFIRQAIREKLSDYKNNQQNSEI